MDYVNLFTDLVIILIVVIGVIAVVTKIANEKKLEKDFENNPKEMFSEFIPIITTVLSEAKQVIDTSRNISDAEEYKHQLATSVIRLIETDYDDELFENEKLSRIARIVTEETLIKGLESVFDLCDGTFDINKLFQDYLDKKEKDLDESPVEFEAQEGESTESSTDSEGDTEDSE